MVEVWPLWLSILLIGSSGLVIGLAGTRLSGYADQLADRTGLGEAFVGAVFLGATTSLSGIAAVATAAADGFPALALSSALGGIAVQTVFLAIADLFYRRANLEHAAASVPNMMMGALLVILLALMLLAMIGPPVALFGVHALTPVLFVGYALGMRLVYKAHAHPMWQPQMTRFTRIDRPAGRGTRAQGSTRRIGAEFAVAAALVALAGWVLTRSAESLAVRTGASESLIGGLLVAVTTSLPELVTSVAAVRRGALTLAVGGVLGGNAFDTLFAGLADVAYRPGPVYQAVGSRELWLVVLTILMTGVLLLGLLHREHKGFANIGFESMLVLLIYALGMTALVAGF